VIFSTNDFADAIDCASANLLSLNSGRAVESKSIDVELVAGFEIAEREEQRRFGPAASTRLHGAGAVDDEDRFTRDADGGARRRRHHDQGVRLLAEFLGQHGRLGFRAEVGLPGELEIVGGVERRRISGDTIVAIAERLGFRLLRADDVTDRIAGLQID